MADQNAQNRYAGLTPQQMIQKMLTEGTGRGNGAGFGADLGEGSFELLCKQFRQVIKKRSYGKIVNGMMQMIEEDVIIGYSLDCKVIKSTCAGNAVGSDAQVFFYQEAKQQWQYEANMADLVDFVLPFYRGLGAAMITPEMLNVVMTQPNSVRGALIGLQTRKRKDPEPKPGEAPKPKDPNAKPRYFRNWAPIPQTQPEMFARAQALDAEDASKKV